MNQGGFKFCGKGLVGDDLPQGQRSPSSPPWVPSLVLLVRGRVLCGWLVMFPVHVIFSRWTVLPLSFLVPTWVELVRV